MLKTIRREAVSCLTAPEGTNFENKIVLAIAIRLDAEKHMASVIADPSFLASIRATQTAKLLKRYRGTTGVDGAVVSIMDQVALMTPENIHLNSFMCEPIVDMSDDHLRALYRKVGPLV